jgi:PAS domain S-box-containing protein
MITPNDYDTLLKDYRDLQLRVTRFSFIEQQLVNTRDQLDHELVLYKRLNKFNKDALKDLSEIEFITLVSEAIIDILEIEVSVFCISYPEDCRETILYIEGKNFDASIQKLFLEDIKKIALKSPDSSAEIFPKRILENYESLNIFSDGISFNFHEKELGYSITLFGLITSQKAPLYQKLDSKHEIIFGIFGQQVQSVLANRKRGEKIKEQVLKISASEIELKKLSLIATKTKNGVIISDQHGKIEWVNDSFTKSTGYSIDDILGKKPKDFLQRLDVDSKVQKQLSNALSKKENVEVKIVNFTKDGLPYYNLIEIIPVFDDEGKHINFISLQKDITAEKMFQDEILRINSRYELIASISNIGIWEWDEKEQKAVWNDVLIAQYGADRTVIGEAFIDFWKQAIYEEDRMKAIQEVESVRNGLIDFTEQEFRIVRHSDKAIRILKCLTIAERDFEGKLIRMVGSANDITEIREAEERLKASEQKYRGIIENMSLGLVEVDLDEKVVFNNKKFNELTLLENASDITISSNVESSLKKKVSQKIILSHKKVDDSVFEIEYRRKDDKVIHLLVSSAPVFSLKNEITGYINIYLDITSVKKLQTNLEKALDERNDFIIKVNELKSFYESILSHSPAKIAVFDPELTLVYANEQLLLKEKIWLKSLGKTLHQIAEENKTEKDRILAITNSVNTSITENRLVQFEETRSNGDGSIGHVLRNVLPYFNSNNELEHIIVSGVNITDLKTIQNDVLEKNLELSKINGELDNFVYRVSHDLRAPLLSIKGILSLLFHTEKFNESVTEYLNLIQNSILRLDETIQEILEYSRNARLEVKLETFNIEEMVQEIFEDLKYTYANEIIFSLEIEGSSFVETDKSRLNTVLKNIIGNSVKYKKANADDCYVNLSIKRLEQFMEITISDNGEGISEKSISRIFEMFYRGTSTSVGTGLGLYITKEILNKLQGTIAVSSEFGVGTMITINLPNLKIDK